MGYSKTRASGDRKGDVGFRLERFSSFQEPQIKGRHASAQCRTSYEAVKSSLGTRTCGSELMLKIILGKIVPGLPLATRRETKVVIAGGYNKGAGSKLEGHRNESHRQGCRFLYDQARTRNG